MISGAEIMVKCLEAEGVSIIFGYPGAAICPFYDALYASSIHHVLVRQEQNAGHAASGFARLSGGVGVCVTTSGPGATNVITAVASAYLDSIPLVIITGQVESHLLGRDVFQEADITGACEPFTKHSYLVEKTGDLPRIFKEAFHIASTGRPGPVLIDIPVDLQLGQIDEFTYPEEVDIIGYKPNLSGHAMQIRRAIDSIKKADYPVIIAGGGVISAKAENELRTFAEQTGIPVVNTMMGVGVLPSAHPLSLGMLGTHGVKAANRAVLQTDLLIVCGARVGDRALAKPDQIANKARVIHIDIDPAEIGKNIPAYIPIVGDIKRVLTDLIQGMEDTPSRQFPGKLEVEPASPKNKPGFVNPKYFLRRLSALVAENSVLSADVGQNQIWAANNYEVKTGRFITSGGMGTMGYSVPAAIGAKMADPARQVMAVCGDGSFQMMFNELATIRQEGLDVKIVVMRNTRLGMVREVQTRQYGDRQSGVSLECSPDFIKLADAFGIKAHSISSDGDVDGAIEKMLSTDGPYLLQCMVDPRENAL